MQRVAHGLSNDAISTVYVTWNGTCNTNVRLGSNAGTVTHRLTYYPGHDNVRLLGLDAVSSDVSKGLLGLKDPKGEGNIILQKVTNHWPKETESYPRGLYS
jgi:hypothetical protein